MKTAEEWSKVADQPHPMSEGGLYGFSNETIRKIQLDAMKHGAEKAAEIARNVPISSRQMVINTILTASSKWTVADLT